MDSWFRAFVLLLALVLLAEALYGTVRGRLPTAGKFVGRAECPDEFRLEMRLNFVTPALLILMLAATAATARRDDYAVAGVVCLPFAEHLLRALLTGRIKALLAKRDRAATPPPATGGSSCSRSCSSPPLQRSCCSSFSLYRNRARPARLALILTTMKAPP